MTAALTEVSPGERVGAPLLQVDGLRIERGPRGQTSTIVSSVGFSLGRGETIGIVGESGSGKSMTAKAIVGLLPGGLRASGSVRFGDRDLLTLRPREWRSIRGRKIGMVLQDPFTMLNPLLRCGEIVAESLAGGPRGARAERRGEVLRRLAEVGIRDESVARRYPFQLSGGMRQRVAIAAALARDPEILIADEPSTALDVATQREILDVIQAVQQSRGMALIMITHDLDVAFSVCDRIHVLYAGSLLEVAGSADLRAEPMHPYSQGLLVSQPPLGRRLERLVAIPGTVPSADAVAGTCAFAARCAWADGVCSHAPPPLVEVAPGRLSACVRLPQIRDEMAAARVQLPASRDLSTAARSGEPVIEVRDVRKLFSSGSHAVTALDGVSLQVGEGESVGIVGESGSGKSTLARLLVGLEHPTSGQLAIGGVTIDSPAPLSRDERRRLHGFVQIVFQDPYSSLNPTRTVGWTLGEAITAHDPSARRPAAQVAELLRSVGLAPAYAERRPALLSGGERQRVAIARALAMRPRILVCDEPVSALDVSVQAQVINLFDDLREQRGLGYVFISHDLSVVRQVADYVYVMHRGKIVEDGATERVLNDPQAPYTVRLIESLPQSQAAER